MTRRAWSESEAEYEMEVRRPGVAYEMPHELAQDEQREINRRVEHARAVCTCHPVPERYHTTHYGATEPGSTLEPDYDCPVHFPGETAEGL